MKNEPMDPQRVLSRRTFLQGTGVVIALPMLDSLLPRAVRAAIGTQPPVRFMSYFVPLGMLMDQWTPTANGANYTLTPNLMPLSTFKNKFTVISGTNNLVCASSGGAHAPGTGGYGTGTKIAGAGQSVRNAISADQQLAAEMIGRTRLNSMYLGLSDFATNDGNFASNYNGSISWSSPTVNLAPVQSPSQIFKTLFPNGKIIDRAVGMNASVGAANGQIEALASTQKSILDGAVSQAQSLQGKLGAYDKQRLDQYLTSLREVEQSIFGLSAAPSGPVGVSATACVLPAAPTSNASIDLQFTQITSLMTLAFQCDSTRIISFMFGAGESYRQYTNLGISGKHHFISHYTSGESGLGYDGNITAIKKIQIYEMQCFARLLTAMDAVKENNGTLLDNTVIVFSSELTDSSQHSYDNMPTLIAGGGSGAIKSNGQHITAANGTELSAVWLTAMQAVGSKTKTFGQNKSSTPITGVL